MRIYIVILFTCLSSTSFCQDLFTPDWAKEGHVNADFAELCGLVTDTEGNVYFAGYARDTFFIDTLAIDPSNHGMYSFICKYNTHGDLQWMSKYSCSEGYSGVRLRSIHLNNNDELVAIGSTSYKTTYNDEYINADEAFERGFIHVVDYNGDTKHYAEFDSLYFWSVTIDMHNSITAIAEPYGLSTTILDTPINANYILFQLSDSLTLNWIQSQAVPHPNPNLYYQTNGGLEFIASNSDGQLFATYNYNDTLYLHDETYLPHNYYTVTIDSIEIDEDSFYVQIDSFYNLGCDAALVKYDSQGNKLWDFILEGQNWQSISGLTADDQGGCYIFCYLDPYDTNYINTNELLITPELLNGYFQKTILHIDSNGHAIDYAFSLDSLSYTAPMVFDAGSLFIPGMIFSNTTYYRNPALGRYTPDFVTEQFGRGTCSYQFPCFSYGSINWIAVHDSSIYALGEYVYHVTLGGYTFYSPEEGSSTGFFLIKLPYDFSEPAVFQDTIIYNFHNAELFPIPASDILTLSLGFKTESIQDCKVININGQTTTLTPIQLDLNNWQFDVSKLTKGVYIFQYTAEGNLHSSKIIKM